MKIYATFHPTSVLEGGFHLEAYIIEDLARFKRKQLSAPKRTLPRAGARVIGFDTEFSPDSKLLTVGLADAKHASAIETTETNWRKRVSPIIQRAKSIAGHSVDGDLDYLVKEGLPCRDEWLRGINVFDSLLLARMVDENRGKGGYALEPLFLGAFNSTPWKQATADLLKKDPDASKWPVEMRVERCRLDSWATRLLAEHYFGLAQEQTEEVQESRLT